MEKITFEEILKAVDGEVYKRGKNHSYSYVETDTRNLKKDCIFIALKGEKFNANEYVAEAIKKGASLCIVDEIKFKEDELRESSIIKVKNTRKALLSLAKYYRSKLDIKVIGVTGSTGKTSTKDLIAASLSEKFKVFKTIGNFNNDIGLPLMVFKLDNSYDVAILEMGMNHFGEIEKLSDVARPDIAVITNVGISHIENLKTRENILKAKLEITTYFTENNILIINTDNDMLSNIKDKNCNILKIGTKDNVDLKAENVNIGEENIEFTLKDCKKEDFRFTLNVPGKHNVLNAMLAIACGKILKLSYKEINDGFKNLKSTSMRLDIIRKNKFTIINDSYNASPDSMKAAIDVLKTLKGNRKIAVFGTMNELGEESFKAHKEVAEYFKNKELDLLIALGKYTDAYEKGSKKENFISFKNCDEAVNYLNSYLNKDDVVLVKASRSMKFENIVNALKETNC